MIGPARNLRTLSSGLAFWTTVLFGGEPIAQACIGDCDGNGAVTVNELVRGVAVALAIRPLDGCEALDRDDDGTVAIAELIAAVGAALAGCPPQSTPTPMATPTDTPDFRILCTRTPIDEPRPSTACVPAPGRFADCFASSGLGLGQYQEQENGAAVADVDGDGFPDVFVWNASGGARLFRNLGHDMQFASISEPTLTWTGETTVVGAAFGDLDNDGRPDLVAVTDRTQLAYFCSEVRGDPFAPYHAYRNLGDGRFEDVSAPWGFTAILAQPGDKPARGGLSLTDLNLDGRLDVVAYGWDFDGGPIAFVSQATGMTWQAAERNLFVDAHGPTWNAFFADLDHDQLIDAYILNDFFDGAPSRYLRRSGPALMYAIGELLPIFGPAVYGSPMGATAADLDGDGELDMVVSDTGDQHVFSRGVDVGRAWGVAQNPSRYGLPPTCWSIAVLDLENDGRPDLFFACGGFRIGFPDKAVSFALRNLGGGAFELATGLLPNEEVPTWEQGLAAADFDQDGRLDLFTGGFEHPPRLLWNRLDGGNHLALRLKGRTVNAEGIGARVTVEAEGLPIQVREMFPGGSTWGYGDAQLLFGLGAAIEARVTVDWRLAGGTAVQTVQLAPGVSVIEEP